MQQLKHSPSILSSQGLLKLIDKLKIIKETCILEVDIKWLNNNYQRGLSKYVFRCSAHRLHELEPAHRYTALVCFLWQTQLDTIDFMIDMHAKLITKVYSQAENQLDIEMQKKCKDIKKSISMLKTIGQILLDKEISDTQLRQTIFSLIETDELKAQIDSVDPWISGKFSHA